MTGTFISRGETQGGDTMCRCKDTRQEDDHVKTEAKTGIMLPQVKEHLELPEAGRVKEGSSPMVSEGAWPL